MIILLIILTSFTYTFFRARERRKSFAKQRSVYSVPKFPKTPDTLVRTENLELRRVPSLCLYKVNKSLHAVIGYNVAVVIGRVHFNIFRKCKKGVHYPLCQQKMGSLKRHQNTFI